MLTRTCKQQVGEDYALLAYRKFLSEIIVDHDIGAQETFHMLQNLPLVVSSHSFITFKVLHRISKKPSDNTVLVSYLHSYIE